MRSISRRSRQKGAVIITVAMVLLFLLGFIGLALDFGKLFVVKTELQTALDSCALAAAEELDGRTTPPGATAIDRARNAGLTAGNLNKVNFQSSTWSGKGQLVAANITFRDAAYSVTTSPAAAKYAQCDHVQPGVQLWLMQALGAFSGATGTFPNTHNVSASAVATRASAQSSCPIPVALMPKTNPAACWLGDCSKANNYGMRVGEWIAVIGSRTPNSGEFGWYNLDGSTGARQTKDQLEGGTCGNKVGDQLGTPGVKTAVDTVWNYRFGIYKNSGDPSVNHPDFSGYSYTATNWKNTVPQNAWSGTPATGSDSTAQNFVTKRAAFASFDDTGTNLKAGSLIVFGNQNALNSFQTLATPGAAGQHALFGADRRVVTVPVIDGTRHVTDYLCMFMLQPLTGPNADAFIEFRGSAALTSSPCTTVGLAGGTAGPLVPVLVR
jgi:Flp pilus assembly protein TadG